MRKYIKTSQRELGIVALLLFAYRYDVSIVFSRIYFGKLERLSKDEADQLHPKMLERMKALRPKLVKLNNEYLKKRRRLADKEFKVLPELVDNKLQPRKKQPSWLVEPGVEMANLREQQGKESFFRLVVRLDLEVPILQ